MAQIIISALLGMLGKIVTSQFIELVVIEAAEILVKKTDNHYDDKLVAEAKKLLGRE